MAKQYDNISEILKEKNLKISHQRIKVFEYLSQNFCHPTADQILSELKKDLPTLSKSRV